jgi:hypothetical protein
VAAVLVIYAVAILLGGLGLLVVVLDPLATVLLSAVVGLLLVVALVWLTRVEMEAR